MRSHKGGIPERLGSIRGSKLYIGIVSRIESEIFLKNTPYYVPILYSGSDHSDSQSRDSDNAKI